MRSISHYAESSAVENVLAAISAAKAHESFHALLSLTEERALARASEIDANPKKGKLSGVPFVIKDNYLVLGAPTTAASTLLENFVSPDKLQATAVEKLEAEGAICIGKANLDAFAHGGSTENSAFGPTKNAVDPTKVAGGSSGGSAVAVALDIVPFALGSDTGGSIRQPASFNGVVGVKPTYGAVSRFGVVAMASGTDCMGCFTSNSLDAELILSIITGHDKRDMTTLPDYFVPSRIAEPKTIGLVKELMSDGVDADVRARINEYAEKMRGLGHTIKEVSLPMLNYSLAMYYVIVPAEISSNLARYDGIRYGRRAESKSLAELYGRSRDLGFMAENKRRIMVGSYVLSSGYFDAYYLKAQKARTLLIKEYAAVFESCDILLAPVAPTPAFGFGENTADPMKMYLADAMTVGPSLAGLPAISVPAGLSQSGLPIGAQLIGPARSDATLLAFARQCEELS